MPIKKAAKKAWRQNLKHAVTNAKVRNSIKDLLKKSRKMIEGKNQGAAEKVKLAVKAIDKAIKKGVLKKNTGARKKSRLMKNLNLMGK